MQLVHFAVQIPKAERVGTDTLLARFREESSGILNWMLRGCLEYQKRGLDPPQAVINATAVYREEQDPIGDFLQECCVEKPSGFISKETFFQQYVLWFEKNHEKGTKMLTKRRFGNCVMNRDGVKNDKRAGQRGWTGLRLKGIKLLLI